MADTNTNGETNVENDYSHKTVSDCLSDKVMAEIARRLQSNLVFNEGGQVVFAPDAPNSKERIWITKDQTGGVVGPMHRYDSPTSTWVSVEGDSSEEGEVAVPFDNPVINRVVQKYDPPSIQPISTSWITAIGSTYNYTPRKDNSFIEYRFVASAAEQTATPEISANMKLLVNNDEQLLSVKQFLWGSDSVFGFGTINYSFIIPSWGKTPRFIEMQLQATSASQVFNLHSLSGGITAQAHLTITEYGN